MRSRVSRRPPTAVSSVVALCLALSVAACGDDSTGPRPPGSGGALPGAATDPAPAAIPRRPFVPRAEDYTDTHPELGRLFASFNTVLLVLQPTTTVGDANALLDEIEAEIVGGVPGVAGDPVASGVLFLRLPTGTHAEMDAALAALRARPSVKYVAPDVLLEGQTVSKPNGNTPAGWTWEIAPAGGNFGLEMIRVPQLWNLNGAVQKAGAPTATGVLDNGFATGHSDLVYAADLTPGVQAQHGTHVAGTIGATFNNGVGVDGVSPFALLLVRGHVFTGSVGAFLTRASYGDQMVSVLDSLIRARPDLRVINLSLGYNWSHVSINTATSAPARLIADTQGAICFVMLAGLAVGGIPLPVLVAAAGNDSDAGFGDQEAQFSSPLTNAALVHGAAPVIVVEAVSLGSAGSATRSGFSNVGGTISAPGSAILSTDLANGYVSLNGTSMATPHVTGLVSYLYSLDPNLPRPTLTANPMRDLLVATSVPAFGGAAPRIDAFAAALDVDRVTGNDRVLRLLLDVDDGTPDGNQRTNPDGSPFLGEDADGDGGPGDGSVDMADFRRWRDWLLETEGAGGLALDGAADHPKKDVNGDAAVGTNAEENIFPRGDFNGDGQLSRDATSPMPGALGGQALTDLQVLQARFGEADYQAADLPGLINSADLEVRPDGCLALPDVATVRSSIRVTGTPATSPLQQRTHTSDDARKVYTAPVDAAGYTALVEALDASGAVLGSDEQDFPLDLGSDARFDPVCSALVINVIFPQQVTPDVATRLDVDVGLRDPATGTVTPAANAQISIVAAGGSVSPASGSTDGQGHFTASATLASGNTLLTLIITATAQSGATATATVTATAGAAGCTIDGAVVRTEAQFAAIRNACVSMGLIDIGVTDGSLVEAVMPSLTQTVDLRIDGNVGLLEVQFPQLQSTVLMTLRGNRDLTTARFPRLSQAGDPSGTNFPEAIIIGSNPELTTLEIGPVRIGGNMDFANNPKLTDLSLLSSGIQADTLYYSVSPHPFPNGFTEDDLLVFANRATFGAVCRNPPDPTGFPECLPGPPWTKPEEVRTGSRQSPKVGAARDQRQ